MKKKVNAHYFVESYCRRALRDDSSGTSFDVFKRELGTGRADEAGQ